MKSVKQLLFACHDIDTKIGCYLQLLENRPINGTGPWQYLEQFRLSKNARTCRKIKLFQNYTLSVFEKEKNERRPCNLCQIEVNHHDQASNQTHGIGPGSALLSVVS